MDQIKPLLVTPDGDGMFTVIGGNMRLRALRELSEDVAGFGVWVLEIDFVRNENDGMYRAVINGRESAKRFVTKEDGMMEYALLDNERSGYYDIDSLANIMPEFNIDWDYSIDFKEANSITEYLDKYAPGSQDDPSESPESTASDGSGEEAMGSETPEASPEGAGESSSETSAPSLPDGDGRPFTVECPDCGCVFEASKHKTQKDASSTVNTLQDLVR